ncbi:MAG: alpha/beta hydrolase [Planctomycetota bacterium]
MSLHFELAGPAGRLEALLDPAEPGANSSVAQSNTVRMGKIGAVVAHPHPQRGGTMHNTNIYRTAKALAAIGIDVLRFNFRGVGRSEGIQGGGGEHLDVLAAVDAMHQYGCGRMVGIGYSFGSIQMFQVGIDDPRMVILGAMGFPVRAYDVAFVRNCTKPTVIVQGEDDVFGSPADVRAAVGDNTKIEIAGIAGAGHFFDGKAEIVANTIAAFVKTQLTINQGF